MKKANERLYGVEVDVFNDKTLEKDFTLNVAQSNSVLEITEIYKQRVAEIRHDDKPLVVMLVEYEDGWEHIVEQFENVTYMSKSNEESLYINGDDFTALGLEKAKSLLASNEDYRKFMVEEWLKNEIDYLERNESLYTTTFLEFFKVHGACYHKTIELLNNLN